LQCVAVRCSVSQCVAVRCSALQCVAVRGSVLQRVAVCYISFSSASYVSAICSLMYMFSFTYTCIFHICIYTYFPGPVLFVHSCLFSYLHICAMTALIVH